MANGGEEPGHSLFTIHHLLFEALDEERRQIQSTDKPMNNKNNQRVYAMPVADVYPMYVQKAGRKGRTKAEVDEVIRWLTGHSQKTLDMGAP